MSSGPRESRLGVVHLVRKANGEEPFRRFLDCYRSHDSGLAHDLILLLKGFDAEDEAEHYRALAADVSSRSLSVSDEGFDVGAYLAAAQQLDHPYLCYLNSYSVIQADGWLEPLTTALTADGVGLVGATGSWGSHLEWLRYILRLGGVYAEVMGDPGRARALLKTVAGEDEIGTVATTIHYAKRALAFMRRMRSLESFPAHHVRTNGFAVEREVALRVHAGPQRHKLDAYCLESGRRSLTRQIERMGLRAVVVGSDGRVWERSEWHRSYTFSQGRQQNLLIADNQTKAYENGTPELRRILSQFAWGRDADPHIPSATAVGGRSGL
jgi:hypothetical protein